MSRTGITWAGKTSIPRRCLPTGKASMHPVFLRKAHTRRRWSSMDESSLWEAMAVRFSALLRTMLDGDTSTCAFSLRLQVPPHWTSGSAVSGSFSKALDIVAVLADDADRSNVLRGENNGRLLQHVSVARSLNVVATVRNSGEESVRLSLPGWLSEWNSGRSSSDSVCSRTASGGNRGSSDHSALIFEGTGL